MNISDEEFQNYRQIHKYVNPKTNLKKLVTALSEMVISTNCLNCGYQLLRTMF